MLYICTVESKNNARRWKQESWERPTLTGGLSLCDGEKEGGRPIAVAFRVPPSLGSLPHRGTPVIMGTGCVPMIMGRCRAIGNKYNYLSLLKKRPCHGKVEKRAELEYIM